MACEQEHTQAAEPPDGHPVGDKTGWSPAEHEADEQLKRPDRSELRITQSGQSAIRPDIPRDDASGTRVVRRQHEKRKERISRIPDRDAAAEDRRAIDEDKQQCP